LLKDFYVAFGTVCFTLLGLWIIVVQTRHSDWRRSATHRRRAYGISLHFSLPGLMSLLALIDPFSSDLWRTAFAVIALGGAAVLMLVRGAAPSALGVAMYCLAIALYLAIGILALAPDIVADLGLSVLPLRVEAVLQTVVVFLGANVAWLLVFDESSAATLRGAE
jgi:hypothetical protein